MAKSKPFAIRLDKEFLDYIDGGVKDKVFGNRNHAINFMVKRYLEKCNK